MILSSTPKMSKLRSWKPSKILRMFLVRIWTHSAMKISKPIEPMMNLTLSARSGFDSMKNASTS